MGTTPMFNDAVLGAWIGAAVFVLITIIFPKPIEKLLEVASFFT